MRLLVLALAAIATLSTQAQEGDPACSAYEGMTQPEATKQFYDLQAKATRLGLELVELRSKESSEETKEKFTATTGELTLTLGQISSLCNCNEELKTTDTCVVQAKVIDRLFSR